MPISRLIMLNLWPNNAPTTHKYKDDFPSVLGPAALERVLLAETGVPIEYTRRYEVYYIRIDYIDWG